MWTSKSYETGITPAMVAIDRAFRRVDTRISQIGEEFNDHVMTPLLVARLEIHRQSRQAVHR